MQRRVQHEPARDHVHRGGRRIGPRGGADTPTVWHLGAIALPKVNVNSDQLAVLAAAAVVAVLLWLLLRHTRIGLEMRAAVDKKELSGLRGMNVARTSGLSWVLTMMISSLAGILIAPLFQLDPNTLTLVVLGSLVAVAVAGLRSIPIAMAGGLALGIIQGLIAFYGKDFLPSTLIQLSGFSSSIPFFLTVVVLFFVGRDRGRQAGSVAEERPRADHREGLPRWRRVLPWAVAVVALVVFTMQASPFTTGAILAPGHRPLHRHAVLRGRHRHRWHGELGPGHLRDRRGLRRRLGHHPPVRLELPPHRLAVAT